MAPPPPPPPPLCLPFSSRKTKYDDDGRPRRRRDQYRSYSDGSTLSRSYTYEANGVGAGEYRNSNYYDHRTRGLGRNNTGKLTRSKSQHARYNGGNNNSRGLPEERQMPENEVYDNEKTSLDYDDYDENLNINPDVGHVMTAGGSPASRPSKVPKNNSRSTARRTEPKRSSLESGSYSPTATMTSKAEKLTFTSDSSSYNVPTLLTEATQVPPKKTFWRRLGLGYGWGLKKSREREKERLGETYPYPSNLTMQNNQSPMLYSTDSNVTIPGPVDMAAPVLSTKASSLQMQMQMQRDAERSGLTRNNTRTTGRSNGSGGVTLAVPSPPLRSDAEANRNPLSRSTTIARGAGAGAGAGKKKLPNVNRSNTKNSMRPSMESHNSASSTLIGSALDRKMNDLGPLKQRVDTSERLLAIRSFMSGAAGGGGAEGLGFYVVPSEDAHGSEYVANSDKRREWISGFTGSSGQAIITPSEAFLITDSRYWLQAEEELDENWTLIRAGSSVPSVPAGTAGGSSVSSPISPNGRGGGEGYFDRSAAGYGEAMVGPDGVRDWVGFLTSRISSPTKVGIDARLVSHSLASYLSAQLSPSGSKLIYPPQNLVDLVWKDRPTREVRMIGIHELRFAGMKAQAKLEMIRAWIRDRPITRPSYKRGEVKDGDKNVGMLVSALDNIAWVLNLRGSDIPYNPVFHSYLFIGLDSATLFVDRAKVSDEVGSYLANMGVEIQEYNAVWTFLRKKPWGPGKIIVPSNTSHAIVLMLTYMYYNLLPVTMPSPIASFQAVKNPTEAEGLRQAYLRDGVAFVKWQAWLEDKLAKEYQITEYEASARLTEYRIQVDKTLTGGNQYMGLAYESISASGAHAALPHYTPVKDDVSFIQRETPYLMDSGGQYLDGTCDTTRTMIFGRPTPEMCEAYTRVLQGHIAIDSAIFPEGTSGLQLDVLARRALWKDGLNYLHGTGHGFGSFLNVHEGPQGFGSPVPFVPGHVLTNEPGFYNDGNWGMRIESALLVRRMKTKNEFQGDIWLGFERLTIVPIQTRMVKESMLTKEEIQWLKDHNRRCREKLEPLVRDDPRALKWLLRETDRGIGLAELALPGGITIDWR